MIYQSRVIIAPVHDLSMQHNCRAAHPIPRMQKQSKKIVDTQNDLDMDFWKWHALFISIALFQYDI